MKFEIKNRFNGNLIFSIETYTWKLAVEAAIKAKVDLRYANLSYADLSGAVLHYANLRSADLSYAHLSYAHLSGANLRSANLRYANLSGADLRSANLRSADLRYANLRDANLMVFQFQQDWAYYTFDGMLRIGCEFHKIETWLEKYQEMGKKNDYSDLQIQMYGKFIEQCALHRELYKPEAKE